MVRTMCKRDKAVSGERETTPMPFYLIVRRYRNNERVLFMSGSQVEARERYRQEQAKLRDGDVMLWDCTRHNELEVTCGGYNRTKW